MINTTYNITFSSKFTGCRGAGACVQYMFTQSSIILMYVIVQRCRLEQSQGRSSIST